MALLEINKLKKEFGDFLLFDDVTFSIDKEDRYYGGPVNHFTEENNQIKNINSKDKFTKKQAKEVAKQLKQKLKEDRQRRKELEKAEKQGAKTDTGAKSSQEAAVFIDANEYIFSNRNYIDKWQFFWQNSGHTDASASGSRGYPRSSGILAENHQGLYRRRQRHFPIRR